MNELFIRSLEASELKNIYPRIEADFAAGEYPPMDVLYKHMQEGSQEGYVLWDGKKYLAYSFCAANPAHDHILITLFAVFSEYRGQGIGTVFLKKLHKIFNPARMVIVEVEKPEEAHTEEERKRRLWRIAFYEKEGYVLIKGIEYYIWDIPLHLMVWSPKFDVTVNYHEIKEIMHQIYFRLLGKRYINKMQIRESSGGI